VEPRSGSPREVRHVIPEKGSASRSKLPMRKLMFARTRGFESHSRRSPSYSKNSITTKLVLIYSVTVLVLLTTLCNQFIFMCETYMFKFCVVLERIFAPTLIF